MVNSIKFIDSKVYQYVKNYFSVKRQLEFHLVLYKIYAYFNHFKLNESFFTRDILYLDTNLSSTYSYIIIICTYIHRSMMSSSFNIHFNQGSS